VTLFKQDEKMDGSADLDEGLRARLKKRHDGL
jgi:hypothetical protein